ncbi:MAG: hypothetical protein CMJ81_12810 [Planctomycetaceae bacterium]|nr:hypothetical protein [Planctomycetaceae bacterium]MBP62803.1 hypothetical protein [Planctomycetaceae bacterium]
MGSGKPFEFAPPVAQVLTVVETNLAMTARYQDRATSTSVLPPPPEQKWVGATVDPRFSNSTGNPPNQLIAMRSNSVF